MMFSNKVNYQTEKLVSSGMGIDVVHDDEEQGRLATLMRGIAAPLHVRKLSRNQTMVDSASNLKGFKTWTWQKKVSWIRLRRRWSGFAKQAEIWGKAMKRIEGYHGSGVLSYFVFMKWLVFLNFYIFLLMLAFVIIPHVISKHNGDSQSTPNYANSSNAVSLANTCSALYIVNVSSSVRDLVQDFLQGTGWMEKTIMFYGGFDHSELSIADVSFQYNMPLAYICVVIVCFLISLISMVRRSGRSFKNAVIASSSENSYTKNVLVAWDFSLIDEESVVLKQLSIYKCLMSDMTEQQRAELRNKMSTGQKYRLYMLRFIINLLILTTLCGGGYLIYYATELSTSFIKGSDYSNSDQYVKLLVEFLPSLTITALNGILPAMFTTLVLYEEYSPGFEIKLTLIRIVFLKLASLSMLLVTLYTQITCSTKDICSVGIAPTCTALRCWETYVGQQLYRLLIIDFGVTIIMVMVVEVIRKVVITKCVCRLTTLIGPLEFDIPKTVLDLVYGQSICWLGFFFAPMLPALCVIEFFVIFYLKMFSALFSCSPSEKPYKASRANNFFMSVLLMAFFLCYFPIGFVIAKISPSKSCGPFRIYSQMYAVFNVATASWPTWLDNIWNLVISGIFIIAIAILILLCLLVYYYAVLARGYKQMTSKMKEHLKSYDNQSLMKKVKKITGEVSDMGGKESEPRLLPVINEKPQLPDTKMLFDKPKPDDKKSNQDNTRVVTIEVHQTTETEANSQDINETRLSTINMLPTNNRSRGVKSPHRKFKVSPEHVEIESHS